MSDGNTIREPGINDDDDGDDDDDDDDSDDSDDDSDDDDDDDNNNNKGNYNNDMGDNIGIDSSLDKDSTKDRQLQQHG